MNSVCKDKILRYEVHPVVKKIITIHCTVVTWEREKLKKHLISTGKG